MGDNPRLFQLSDFLATLRRRIARDHPDAFRANILKAMHPYIDHSSAIWGEAHIKDQMTLHAPEIINLPRRELNNIQTAAYSDPHMLQVFKKPGRPISYSIDRNAPPSLAQLSKRHNIGHVMSTAYFQPDLGLASGIVLIRGIDSRPFTPGETDFMQAAFPHLLRAWTDNQIAFVKEKALNHQRILYVAAVGRSGEISGIEDGFIRTLSDEWPNFNGSRPPRAIRELLRATKSGKFVGKRIVVQTYEANDIHLLVARKKFAADDLTPRQRKVAKLCVAGNSYREIAAELSIAPSTARNHVAAIHKKLNVSRNSEIAHHLHLVE